MNYDYLCISRLLAKTYRNCCHRQSLSYQLRWGPVSGTFLNHLGIKFDGVGTHNWALLIMSKPPLWPADVETLATTRLVEMTLTRLRSLSPTGKT